ncbi:MAG: hypothetical protein U0271_28895 [Polyangiaceae bacterium]
MFVYLGQTMTGRVDRCGSGFIGTMFFHIYFIPIAPMGSRAVIRQLANGHYQGIPLGIHGRSLLLGYARVWLFIAGLGLVALALSAAARGSSLLALPCLIAAAGAVVLGVLSNTRFGRLTVDEKAMRFVYQDWVGAAVDPGVLPRAYREELKRSLHGFLESSGQKLVGYRSVVSRAPTDQELLELAVHRFTEDTPYLAAALTLARLEEVSAKGDASQALRDRHHDIWEKLKRLDPRCVHWAQADRG